MIWVLIVSALFLMELAFLAKKVVWHPVVVFSAVWGVIFILYQLNLHGYYALDALSFTLFLIMLFAFAAGSFLADALWRRRALGSRTIPEADGAAEGIEKRFELRPAAFWITALLSCAFLLPDAINTLRQMMSHMSLNEIALYGDINEGATGIMVPINIFLVYPVTYAISPICSVEYVTGNPKKYRYLLVNIVVTVLSMLHHGGRYTIVFFVISYVFAFLVYGRQIRLSRLAKRVMLSVFIAFVIAFVFVSLSRGIEDLVESVYSYLVCSVPHMISRLATSETGIAGSTHGLLSLNGFVAPFMILLKGLGIIQDGPVVYQTAQLILQRIEEVAWIGSNVTTNAFLPPAFYLYMDGGVVGVLAGMLAYGFVASLTFENVLLSKNNRDSAMYLLIVFGLVTSFVRLFFSSYSYALAVFYILFIFRRDAGRPKSSTDVR